MCCKRAFILISVIVVKLISQSRIAVFSRLTRKWLITSSRRWPVPCTSAPHLINTPRSNLPNDWIYCRNNSIFCYKLRMIGLGNEYWMTRAWIFQQEGSIGATLFLAPLITWAIDASNLRSRQPDANAAAMQAVATITVATNYVCEVG